MPILMNGKCYKTFGGAVRAVKKKKRIGLKRARAYVATVHRRQRFGKAKSVVAACRGRLGKTARPLGRKRKRRAHRYVKVRLNRYRKKSAASVYQPFFGWKPQRYYAWWQFP